MSLLDPSAVPVCPTDQFRMIATAVGWRCPICGLARLPITASGTTPDRRTHPSYAGRTAR